MTELIDRRTAIDDLEPDEAASAYRECAQRMVFVLNYAMLWMLQGRMSPQSFWQVAFAIGLPLCEGRSMSTTADELRITRQAISKGAKAFQKALGLPPSEYMKATAAIASYSKARKKQL